MYLTSFYVRVVTKFMWWCRADVSQSYKCAAIDSEWDAKPLSRIVQLTHRPALF